MPTSLFCVAKCFARGATAPQLHNQSRLLFPALACCMMPKAMCKIFRGHQSSSVRFKHCSEKLAFVFCSSNVKASVFKADGPFYASSHEWKHGLVSIGLLACGVAKGVLQLLGGGGRVLLVCVPLTFWVPRRRRSSPRTTMLGRSSSEVPLCAAAHAAPPWPVALQRFWPVALQRPSWPLPRRRAPSRHRAFRPSRHRAFRRAPSRHRAFVAACAPPRSACWACARLPLRCRARQLGRASRSPPAGLHQRVAAFRGPSHAVVRCTSGIAAPRCAGRAVSQRSNDDAHRSRSARHLNMI